MPKIKDLIIKTEKINWKLLKDLQPSNLKTKENTEFTKKSLIENNFAFSFYVWEKDGQVFIIDGHLRSSILYELEREGYEIPKKLSCTFLDLPNKKAAVKYLLEVFNSKKNKIQEITLNDWIEEEDISPDEIDLEVLDIEIVEAKENPETEQLPDSEMDNSIPEIKDKPFVVRGDIFEIKAQGCKYRVGCLDSTCIDDVEKLMDGKKADMIFTDPPYGINLVFDGKAGGNGAWKKQAYKKIANDSSIDVARDVFNSYTQFASNIVYWGANYFDFLPSSKCWIAWYKKEGLPDDTFCDTELAYTNYDKHSKTISVNWRGMIKEGEMGEKRVHPTQKPVLLAEKVFEYLEVKDSVLDLFAGSGSTLIACIKTKRNCFTCDVDEHYTQITLKRAVDYLEKNNIDFEVTLNNQKFDLNQLKPHEIQETRPSQS